MGEVQAQRLCQHIIGQQFGSIVQQVAATLLARGRLSLPFLLKFSGLKKKQIKDSLFILMQHSLISYADVVEGSRLMTYYTIEVDAILDRANIMNALELTQERFGLMGFMISKTLLLHGKLKLKEVIAHVEDELKMEGSTEELKKNENKNIKQVFQEMIIKRFILGIEPKDSITKKDIEMEEYRKEINALGLNPSLIRLKKARESFNLRKQNKYINPDVYVGIKRSWDSNGVSKVAKRKTNCNEMELEIDEEAYFIFNLQKLNIQIRNKQILGYIKERVNAGASEVLRCFIEFTEHGTLNFHQNKSTKANHVDIIPYLTKDFPLHLYIDLTSSIHSNGQENPYQASHYVLFSEFLKIIQQDESHFLIQADDRSTGYYQIDYHAVGQILKLRFLEMVIKRRYGAMSWRIFRLLLLRGKMEEKQIIKLVILEPTEARKRLDAMALDNLVQLQEVPKTANREPSRTFYLWEVQLPKAFESMKELILKSLSNLIERRGAELKNHATLLAKLEREDVQKDIGLLSSTDRKMLENLNSMLDLIDVEYMKFAEWLSALRWF